MDTQSTPKGFSKLNHEPRKHKAGAQLLHRAEPNEKIHLTVHLKKSNETQLPSMEYWAKTSIKDRVYPDPSKANLTSAINENTVERITYFANRFGLKVLKVNPGPGTIELGGTVQEAERAFAVELNYYKTENEVYRGKEGYTHVPEEIADIVDDVMGFDNRKVGHRRVTNQASAVSLSPVTVSILYNFPPAVNISQQKVAILEFGGGYAESDIYAFCDELGIARPTSITPVSVGTATNSPDGSVNNFDSDKGVDVEVALDMEIIATIAPGVNLVVYFADNTPEGWVNCIQQAVYDTTNAPLVISISWGGLEDQAFSSDDLQKITKAFNYAASIGITVLVSTGDDGVCCLANDTQVHVEYPASDPWVIACGGTIVQNVVGTSFDEETWNDGDGGGASGGGFSKVFVPQPTWQNITGITSLNPNGIQGRGMPDVAGNASSYSGYDIILYGKKSSTLLYTAGADKGNPAGPVGGTSAVAPLYAGLIALINGQIGRRIGYINPQLYKIGTTNSFNDITSGNNSYYNYSDQPVAGYSAQNGWDPCTGWGSINGKNLLSALTSPA